MKTHIYVDGLNLYNGSLKRTKFKWLDLYKCFQTILGTDYTIEKIYYFTSPVNGKEKAQRQNLYHQALKGHCGPLVEIHLGKFITHSDTMPLDPLGSGSVKVIKREEKQTDVNIAVHLLNDGWLNRCDCAVLVSNDSDFVPALRITKKSTGKAIGLIKPVRRSKNRGRSNELSSHADHDRIFEYISSSVLKQCQLPEKITSITGSIIQKPTNW